MSASQVAAELKPVGASAEREHGGQQAQRRLTDAHAALQVQYWGRKGMLERMYRVGPKL